MHFKFFPGKIWVFLPLVLVISFASLATAQDDYEWIQLFNGEDLEGWDFHIAGQQLNEDPRNTLKVSDGILHVDYSEYQNFNGAFGHFAHDEIYSHYIYATEHRFIGEQTPGGPDWGFRNNGIMFHSQSMASMSINQEFPRSVEAQLLQRGTDQNPTAVINLCNGVSQTTVAERVNCSETQASVPLAHKDDWVRAEILVLGDSIAKFILNKNDTVGVFTQFKLSSNGQPLSEGIIALQMESHPTDFRKIEMVNLVGCMDPTASNYKDYFVKNDPESCITGISGCMDPAFEEYNPEATISDPSACQTTGTIAYQEFKSITIDPKNLSVNVPIEGFHSVVVKNLMGAKAYSAEGTVPYFYELKESLPTGIHFITVTYDKYQATRRVIKL